MEKLIIFLICKKLHLKRYEPFQFNNQKSKDDYYYFDKIDLKKVHFDETSNTKIYPAHVSLNWFLDKDCTVRKIMLE